MPEPVAPILLILLSACAGLLVVVLLLLVRISMRLARLEKLSNRSSSRSETSAPAPSLAETSPGGAFEVFLSEDPDRRNLTKGEQFSAYRQWRQEKGMNWSNS